MITSEIKSLKKNLKENQKEFLHPSEKHGCLMLSGSESV